MGTPPPGISLKIRSRYLTNKTSVSALRNDSNVVLVAVLHDARHLLGSLGLNDDLAVTMVLVHPVVVEVGQVVCGG